MLKSSTLHAGIEHEIDKADKALNELVQRSGAKGIVYQRITRRMAKLKDALNQVQTSGQSPRQLHSETTAKMRKILRSDIPPSSSDALSKLVPKDDDSEEAEAPPAKAAPVKKTAKGKKTAKAAKGKKTTATPKKVKTAAPAKKKT